MLQYRQVPLRSKTYAVSYNKKPQRPRINMASNATTHYNSHDSHAAPSA